MKFLKQLPLLALLAILAFSSCQKEADFTSEVEIPTVEPTETEVNGLMARMAHSADGLDLGCISIDYPFSMILMDSSIVEITSEEDFIEELDDEDNPPIDFVYPLSVTDEDGESFSVSDAEALAEIFADCIPDTGWDDDFNEWFFPAWEINFDNSCYQLVYPVTLLDVDSMSVTANDESEFIAYLADGNIYSFAFPIDLEDEDGNIVTADDPDDLFDLLSDCSPEPGPGGCGIGTFGCYEFGYPATLLLIDGTTVVVNDDDEFAAVLVSGDWAGFEFPLTLIDEDGEETVVNDEEELNEALLDCAGFDDGPHFETGDFLCYNLVYPFSITDLQTGDEVTFNDSEEWFEYQVSDPNGPAPFEFVYPFTLVNIETGEETVLNNAEDIEDAVGACFGVGGGGSDPDPEFGEFLCYNFVYPFSAKNLDTGDVITFANSDEWFNFQVNNPNGPSFEPVYPFSLTEIETGDEITVNDEEELITAVEHCF